jgi:probable F420-dependent oxidoreductase
MTDQTTVTTARRALGPIGAMLPNPAFAPQPTVTDQRAAAVRLERAGYPAIWVNEGVGGKDAFTQMAILLAATDRVTFAGGVLNMWARPPETAHGAATYLAQAFPDRFVAGFGIGFPFQAEVVGAEYRRPAATARRYLERLPHPQPITPQLDASYAALLAATGPRMLDVAAAAADGVLIGVQPTEFTAQARRRLGEDKIVAVGLPFVIGDDAREQAREFASRVMGVDGSPYAAGLLRLGYSERDVRTGADAVVDAVVAHGTPADVVRQVGAHRRAGADHIRLDPVAHDLDTALRQLERVATITVSADASARS